MIRSNSDMASFELLHPAIQHHVVNTLRWDALRPSQEEAIEPILLGEDLLIQAPTAGGKTEAALLPLLSRMHTERWGCPSILYLCPLRALLNNLLPRVETLSGFVGRRAALWHGDVPDSTRRRILREPPDILLTTPESVEAMLISTRVDAQALFGGVRAVVVDELHAFAGDDRGWHLLAAISRVESLAKLRLQRIGLSATIGNPDDLAAWLAGPGSPVPARIRSSDGNGDPELTIDCVGSLENASIVIQRLFPGEKRLVFCDSRARVEELAMHLRGSGLETFVSHSSLAQDERRRAEAAFAEGVDCAIVATSTLELGLDVGDLDRVVQIDAPAAVSSFLQRMGRSGRRPGTVRNCLFLATEPDAFLQACGILHLWSQGFVEEVEPPPAPWHLFSQQLMALVLQEPGISTLDALHRIQGAAPFVDLSPEEGNGILHFMLETEILHEDGGILSFGREGERRFGRRHFMDLVSAFTTEPLFLVRSGRVDLGSVHPKSFISPDDRPPVLLLGGRSWAVTEIDWEAHVAWVEPTKTEGRSRWPGSSRALHSSLCRAVREVLAGNSKVDSFLSQRGRQLLTDLQEEHSWVKSGKTTLLRSGGGHQWWTFAGFLANGMIAAALERAGCRIRRYDNYSLSFDGDVDTDIETLRTASFDPERFRPVVSDRLVENLKFSAALPLETGRIILELRQSDFKSVEKTLCEPISKVVMNH